MNHAQRFLVVLGVLIAGPGARGQEAAVKAGEAFIRRYDTNGDGWLNFEELKDADQFKKMDKNGDGKITVADFLQKATSSGSDRMMMMNNRELYRYYGFHTIGKYDRNHDGVLDEEELRFLLITVMDKDEDQVVNAAEIKRSLSPPGLALEEGWFQKDAKALDTNGDGVITSAEMRVPEVVMHALDKNRDGRVSLEEMAHAQVNVMGGYLPRLHEISDSIGKLGKLDKANWLGDPDMFRRLDEDKDGFVSVPEFDRYTRALRTTLSLCNDFVTRQDLDGDLKVSRREFSGTDSMFLRMDRNHDGAVTAADR